MIEETTSQGPGGDDRGARTPYSRDKDMGEGGGRFKGRKRRKVSYLTINKIETVDYKDVAILRRFINDRGKILPSRQSGNTAKQQRMIARAIRRARELALLPFVVNDMSAGDRREFGPRRDRGDRGDRGERYGERRDTRPRSDEAPAAEAPAKTEEAPAVGAPAETESTIEFVAAPEAAAAPVPEVAEAPAEASPVLVEEPPVAESSEEPAPAAE